MKRALLFAALLLLALVAACRHAPTGSWDVPPNPDAGTADLSWGMP